MKKDLKLKIRRTKIYKTKRNYIDIISCYDSSITNIGKCNNKYGI